MMMKFNFKEKFEDLQKEKTGTQKRVNINASLKIYYGVTSDNYFRISFISSIEPPKIESTKEMRVSQGLESKMVYWTCFDLLDDSIKNVFFLFCKSLLLSFEGINNEYDSLIAIRNRFNAWKNLFKNKSKMSFEKYLGLYGELYFLYNHLNINYDIETCINAWVGPDGYSKDFSILNKWYEVKTIGSSQNKVTINSISQLDSNNSGYLVILRVEKMSNMYVNKQSNIKKIIDCLFEKTSNIDIREKIINKTLEYGYIYEDDNNENNFEVKSLNLYLVNDAFPRLKKKDIDNNAISNVSYDLLISQIEKYKEDLKNGNK